MILKTVFMRAFSLTGKAWFEALVFSVFLAPVYWLSLEAVIASNTNLARALSMFPQVIFTALSGAVLYHQFENITNGTQNEMSLKEWGIVLGRLIAVTAVVDLIVWIGTGFCLIPGIYALSALFLAQVSIFKSRHGIVAALDESMSKTSGHRIEVLLCYLAVCLVAVPAFFGSLLCLNLTVDRHILSGQELVASYTMFSKVVWAVGLGVLAAYVGTFMRALEFSFYMEASRRPDRWIPPPQPDGAPEPVVPVRKPSPIRQPIDVGPDIVFGDPTDDQ